MKGEPMLTYKASKNDVLGDGWARQIERVWAKMKELDPTTCAIPGAYSLWQYAQCYVAEMEHRIVASPQACVITGAPVPLDQIDDLEALNDRAVEALRDDG